MLLLIRLLVTKGRESNFPEIITAFIHQYKEYKNIHTVKLTTATPISEDVKNAISKPGKKAGGIENIELEEKLMKILLADLYCR